jgi:23S rRNA (uracil1939-C5)-methyltransferase
VLPELAQRLEGTRPLVSVNPARRGLEPGVVAAIDQLQPRRVAYISCNPSALARDLNALREIGLKPVGDVELFDMFPNTAHVECLVLLEAEDADAPTRRAPRRKVVRPQAKKPAKRSRKGTEK